MALAMVLFMFACGGVALAQDAPVPPELPPMDWNEIIAYAINTTVVFTLVRLITRYKPSMSAMMKQILALAGGPLLMMFVQPYLSNALGHPIDLSALSAALSGLASSLTAMGFYDAAKLAGGGK